MQAGLCGNEPTKSMPKDARASRTVGFMSRYQGKLFTFLGLLVLLCMYPVIRIISVGDILLASGDAMLLMWAPTIAAVLTKLIFDRSLRGFGFGLHGWPVLLAAYLLPVMGGGLVYGFAWVSGIGTLDAGLLSVFGPLQWIGLAGIPLSLLTALGEEIGWRGFLVPELARRYGYTATALISAAVWSVYHYPLVIWGGYNNGFSVPLSLLIFTVSVTGISFVTAWMRMKTAACGGLRCFMLRTTTLSKACLTR